MPALDAPVLALDAASPRVSVAVARGARVLAARDEPLERSSRRLLEMIDDVLREAGLRPADLAGLVALRGPGSFTGLRVGLATALGLHQALAIPATALSTLEVLASLAPREEDRAAPVPPGLPGLPVIAAVDVLRGDWAIQAWPPGGPRAGSPSTGLQILPLAGLAQLAPCVVVASGATALAAALGEPRGLHPVEAGPLAPAALALLAAPDRPRLPAWDPSLLTAPIYGRPPAVTLPKPRRIPSSPLRQASARFAAPERGGAGAGGGSSHGSHGSEAAGPRGALEPAR